MINSDSEESGEDDNDVTPRVDDVTPNLVTSQEDTTEKNVAEALDGHVSEMGNCTSYGRGII